MEGYSTGETLDVVGEFTDDEGGEGDTANGTILPDGTDTLL
jgi:hypothetical protein